MMCKLCKHLRVDPKKRTKKKEREKERERERERRRWEALVRDLMLRVRAEESDWPQLLRNHSVPLQLVCSRTRMREKKRIIIIKNFLKCL